MRNARASDVCIRSPRTLSMSSWFFSRRPSVSSIDVGVEHVAIERDERRRPVERLGDAGGLVEIRRAQLLHERGDLSAPAAPMRRAPSTSRFASSLSKSGYGIQL